MKRKGKYYLLAAFAALAVTVCVGGYSAWQYFWGGAVARDAVVLVPTGSDFDRLTDSLRRSGALRNVRKFVRIARIRGLDETVRPGRYKLDAGMTYAALIDQLVTMEVTATERYCGVLRSIGKTVPDIDPRLEHMLVTGMMNAYCEIIIHDMPLADAQRYLEELSDFYTAGWLKIMGQ